MSLRISIACEDHTLDQYIIKPVIRNLFADLGRPRARVEMITSPRLQGFSTLKQNASALLDRYGTISDLVLFVMDADGKDGASGRPDRRKEFEEMIRTHEYSDKSLVIAAQQELEVWSLWGCRNDLGATWAEVRSERDPKELYFEPLVTSADRRTPGAGRQRLISLSLKEGWRSFIHGCPEVQWLEQEIRHKLAL